MSVPTKVLRRVIILRIREGVDAQLRNEQADFRRGRSTTEQIFVLRNIFEQVIELNAGMYACNVDFEKACDSVNINIIMKAT